MKLIFMFRSREIAVIIETITNEINIILYNLSFNGLFDVFGVSTKSNFLDSQIPSIPKINAILTKFKK